MHTICRSYTPQDDLPEAWDVEFLFNNELGEIETTKVKRTLLFDEAVALCSRLNGGDGLTLDQRISLARLSGKQVVWSRDLEDQAQELRTSSKRFSRLLFPLLLLFFPLLLTSQSVKTGSGYLDTLTVTSFPLVEYRTEAYDRYLREVNIWYSKTPDSVLVGWDKYLYYQDTICERSLLESAAMYNLVLKNIFNQ